MVRHRIESRYSGEDTRPTTPQELLGWYSYGLAAEVFAVCGVGSFLPVTLEQLARESGVLRSDGITPCVQPAAVQARQLLARDNDGQCVVHIFGAEINTSSFALYSSSLAVFTQAIVLISIGAIADYGANRKRLLLVLGYTGALASMLFILVFPAIYLVSVVLTVLSVASLGCSFVLLNSFLPLLAANHPLLSSSTESEVPLRPINEDEDADPLMDDYLTSGLLDGAQSDKYQNEDKPSALSLSNKISSKGVGIGYTAAVFVQILCIGIIVLYSKLAPSLSSSTLPMRTVLFVVGLWWALFIVPTILWLRPRPGPPLPVQRNTGGIASWLSYIVFGWKSLWRTVKIAVKLRQMIIYLVGWFLLSDAIATIGGTAILFARTELKLSTEAVAILSVTATAAGIAGAAAWPWIQRRFALSSMAIVMICVTMYEFIPLYGLAGFLPFVRSIGVGGIQQQWEIFPLGFLLGFIMGGISSYCRSVFGLMIPPGMEAAFYALFAITDKGSSVIGPTIVGRIIDATGRIRMGFWFLSVLMISPLPFFWFVDLERAREEGVMMTKNMRHITDSESRDD